MASEEYTRRSVMRRGIAAVGAGALASTAGCLGGLTGGGASYQNWLPVPDEISTSDHYQFMYLELAGYAKHEDELADETADSLDSLEGFWDPVGVDWDEVSSLVFLDRKMVIEAEFTREDVVDDLEDEDYDDDTDHEGYTIFVDERETRAFAVGDGTIVVGGQSEAGDPVDTVEAFIDVDAGEEDSYVDESDAMSDLLGELGSSTTVQGRTMEEPDDDNPENGIFDHMVAEGRTTTINGETTKMKWAVVYEDSDDVDLDDLEDWADEQDGSGREFDDVDDLSYNKKGRLGVITGTKDTDDL